MEGKYKAIIEMLRSDEIRNEIKSIFIEALKENKKKPSKTISSEDKENAIKVIEFFNEHCGKNSRNTSSNIDFIKARFSEGYSVDDCINVIKLQYSKWENDEVMSKYIRIATLFNKQKFNNYFADIKTDKVKVKIDQNEEVY